MPRLCGLGCIAMISVLSACSSADNTGAGGASASSGGPSGSGASTSSAGSGSGGTCAHALDHVDVSLSAAATGPAYGAATADGATAFAWSDGKSVFLTRVDAAGKSLGADLSVPGLHVHGLAPSDDGYAMLVARGADELAFVKLDPTGKVLVDEMLTGKSDHAVVGSEWYDFEPAFAADGGRLLWANGRYVAYFPIFRRWPDMIAHTGDTLRFLDPKGAQQMGGWDWGCSHSLDVRVADNGTLAPVCLSDCYAEKAILFSDKTVISSEPSGNCMGSSNAALGGLVATKSGFYLTYVSGEGRMSKDIALVPVANDGKPGTVEWLTADATDQSAAHLAAFEGGLLATWKDMAGSTLALFDSAGAMKGAPQPIDASFRDKDDLFGYPNGDVGWLWPSSKTMTIYRYKACP